MSRDIVTYTKQSLIERFKEIQEQGWIKGTRQGNNGNVGNTMEDLLGIEENNLPIPNAAEWELKCQRLKSNSLTTLFHLEPSPQALKFVPNILLPLYGWTHKEAGQKYPENEMSFRQTISTNGRSDRGFAVIVDRKEQKILISFDPNCVASKHEQWLNNITKKIDLGELNPQPYWGFDDLYHKAGTKIHNCFFIQALHEKCDGIEFFKYTNIFMLQKFTKEKFISAIENGSILIDFDARTRHNHGTKFRFRNNQLPFLYEDVLSI